MQRPKTTDRVLVEIYQPKTDANEWLPGTVKGTQAAQDRDYRVNVALDDGRHVQGVAPECIKPQIELGNQVKDEDLNSEHYAGTIGVVTETTPLVVVKFWYHSVIYTPAQALQYLTF